MEGTMQTTYSNQLQPRQLRFSSLARAVKYAGERAAGEVRRVRYGHLLFSLGLALRRTSSTYTQRSDGVILLMFY